MSQFLVCFEEGIPSWFPFQNLTNRYKPILTPLEDIPLQLPTHRELGPTSSACSTSPEEVAFQVLLLGGQEF